MKRVGLSTHLKVSMLLAALLCLVMAIATPVKASSCATAPATVAHTASDQLPFTVIAGETVSTPALITLQAEKALLLQVIAAVLNQLYPQSGAEQLPNPLSFSRAVTAHFTALTKGP
ncbi:hypothetical protein ACFSKU_16090 [Pontibacter silvestris]|uniref:Uncharacterized protein n=1 Tax=Pontibacter silvestris TaxID=2305183 RepID=A0ABW4X1C7_9BACT|nr:hypothetical protein [Pontibacter silvestris]MCC9135991.1 hypothetical protein [Pontibacter silvestris]